MATITGGRTVRPVLSPCDTPDVPQSTAGVSQRDAAEAAWRAIVPALAGTPHVRISKDGGKTYPARHVRPLPAEPPLQPCTVPVFDPGTGTGRMLVLDLDPGRSVSTRPVINVPPGVRNVTAGCDAQAAELGQLLDRLGARYIADVSPSGGRHVLVLFASLLPWRELRDLARAIAVRFPAVDVSPMCSLAGQISPPGSRHKSGGWRLLSTPLSEALEAVKHPNGPKTWAALLTEFAAELRAVDQLGAERVDQVDGERVGPESELDDAGVPWVPRLGGRANLGPELDRTARTGRWDRSRHAGRSEARMAVLCAAAARGWRLADVRAAVASGAWKGLEGLYHRASEPGRMERLLPYEWRKSVAFATGSDYVRGWHTSDLKDSRPPAGDDVSAAEYGLIRVWMTAVLVALEDPERVRGWGGRAIAVRLALLALGQAAMVSGSSTVEFGCRQLALYSCLSHRTVARVLRQLADEEDPLIDLVSPRRLARADRYALRIPDRYADSVRWRRRRAGRVDAAHPVFLVLGGVPALVYQVLEANEVRGAEVARAARLSPSAVSSALRVLAEHGLAGRGPGGWRRGPARLDDVAESTGAADLHREREERYRQDRESWRARLRQYAGARKAPVMAGDGWWSVDDDGDWESMLLSRWPVLDDVVRGPPPGKVKRIAGVA